MVDLTKTIELVIGIISMISFFTGFALSWRAALIIRDRTLIPANDNYNFAIRVYYNAFDRAVPMWAQRQYLLSYFLLTFTIAGWFIISFLSINYMGAAFSGVMSCVLLSTSIQTWMRFKKANKQRCGES